MAHGAVEIAAVALAERGRRVMLRMQLQLTLYHIGQLFTVMHAPFAQRRDGSGFDMHEQRHHGLMRHIRGMGGVAVTPTFIHRRGACTGNNPARQFLRRRLRRLQHMDEVDLQSA